jgi:hypothetical protein
LSSSRSRRRKRGDFYPVRRDAIAFVLGLAALCGASVAAGAVRTQAHPAEATAAENRVVAASASPDAGASATAAAGGVEHVAHPWKSGQTQLGIDVYWAAISGESDAAIDQKIIETVDDVASLGANWISLSFPFVTPDITANEVSASPTITPSLNYLKTFIVTARAAGLQVALRPLLDQTSLNTRHDPKAWRGTIAPAHVSAWFTSYQALLTTYAALARQAGAGAFYVSTELSSMEGYAGHWAALIAAIRRTYGAAVYDSVNWDRLTPNVPRVPDADLAVDAYFPMAGFGNNASVAELASGWNGWLNRYRSGDLSDLTFSEVGIVPEDGAYQDPFTQHTGKSADTRIRVNWYQAACRVALQRHVGGLYWWYLNLENIDQSSAWLAANDPMSIQNTTGATVIEHCFAGYTG